MHYLLTPGQDATIQFSSFCGVEAPPPPPATKTPPPPPVIKALPPLLPVPPHCYNKTGQLVTTSQIYICFISTRQIDTTLFYSPADLNGITHFTNIEKTSIIHESFNSHMKKYITQDTYSVTYNPGFLSFLPTKDTEMKLTSQTHHNTTT